jgi:hypothetical protein
MSDRIDDFLRGAAGGDALTAAERADADAASRAIDGTRAFLGARPAPDLTASVLRRIEPIGAPPAARPEGRLIRVARSVWNPVQFSVRPAYALLAVTAGFVLLIVAPPGPAATDEPGAAAGAPLFVQFRLDTEASTVQLAGSFTNWERRYPLRETAPGIWTVTVPLSQGVHDYAFVVDGQHWVADPHVSQVSDGFGGTNNRLTLLLPPGASQS